MDGVPRSREKPILVSGRISQHGLDEAVRMMLSIQEQLRRKLIVSCQACRATRWKIRMPFGGWLWRQLQGGAAGLRINSAEHIAAIRRDSDVPIIGIQKRFMNGVYRITPDFEAAQALAAAGASIIALDCTDRSWPAGDPCRNWLAHSRGAVSSHHGRRGHSR